ncbi:ABC transporter permease [Mesorhizobium sp. B3-1-9]|uniref:ABC transporter permease n=1 Tax=unclassified Mesorhizobium TaxID=325217 RepID=UPI0011296961|nr:MULTISPECIES: ABC transporter permease [unclassified Mesorhizobium]TPI40318.1 ABC transporter permease [Mesorhizobium sp. B3-1-9]TPI64957.1 ABC transporter permease [Mesorhizobium sp. B3-1-8]TPI75762.1 ABC transporter permease [Mesorhizobium sp. B3-1-3]
MAAIRKSKMISGATLLRLVLLAALVAAFAIWNPAFISGRNLYALMQSFALLGMVALGLSLTMIAGEFDLSVGSMVAVGGLITLVIGAGNLVHGMVAALAFAVLVGLVNAFVISRFKVSSLVVSVGSMMALSGFAFWLAGGKVISTDNFDLGMALDDPLLTVLSWRSVVTLAAFLLVGLFMHYTLMGRDIRVVGSKPQVAAASGARVGRSLVIVFVLSAATAALAGSLLSMSLASAAATTGSTLMLQAVSAAIVGGVALSGGSGTPAHVLLGSLILTVMNNGLSLIGMGATGILFANGLVLMGIVLLDGQLGAWMSERLAMSRAVHSA